MARCSLALTTVVPILALGKGARMGHPASGELEVPHCIFEYSANIVDDPEWPVIMKNVHERLVASDQFVAGDIKGRVIKHNNYVIGNGEDNQSFVTLNLQILEGRSDEIKRELSQSALDILVAAFPESLAKQKCSITVQVSDIHRASYQRHISY